MSQKNATDRTTFNIVETAQDDIPSLRRMHAASWRATYPNETRGVSAEWVNERTAGWLTPEGVEKSREHFRDIFGNPSHFHRIVKRVKR